MIIAIIITPTTPPITTPIRGLDSLGSENIPTIFNHRRHQVHMKYTSKQDDDSLND
jgi:hypothetical protein